jgi:hypothetical protein
MAVYWVGQDGNIWLKSDQGTRNVGSATDPKYNYNLGPGGFESNTLLQSIMADRIPDPLPGGIKPTSPRVTSSTSSSSNRPTVANPVLNQSAIDQTNKAINSLGAETDIGRQNIANQHASVLSGYDLEAARNTNDFNDQTGVNNQNLLKNKQNALIAGAQGRRGLRGTLASLGALSGDGSLLADRAVTQATNADIGNAVDTYATNAQSLANGLGNFTEEDARRRAAASVEVENLHKALEGSVAKKRQGYYQDMAKLYEAGGNVPAAANWLNQAGDLNNLIVQNGVVAAPIATRTAAYTPASLESYLAGAGDMTVKTQSAPSLPASIAPSASIFAGHSNRKDERRNGPF